MTNVTNSETNGITLLPCPFCGGEATVRSSGYLYRAVCDTCGSEGSYATKNIKAAKAWNTRAEYHGFEQAAIESWENIKAWNTRHVETCTIECNESGCNFAYRLYTLSCGHTVWTMGDAPNYCPNCGKKVEG